MAALCIYLFPSLALWRCVRLPLPGLYITVSVGKVEKDSMPVISSCSQPLSQNSSVYYPIKHGQNPWRLDWGQTKTSQIWTKISPDLNQDVENGRPSDVLVTYYWWRTGNDVMIISIWAVIWPSPERHRRTSSWRHLPCWVMNHTLFNWFYIV